MSFYPQPNEWTCGPFALKYALVMHGRFENEIEISRRAGAHWWNGTNEISLSRAARYYGCTLKSIRRTEAERARKTLNKYLRKKIPCILCVDEWNHWVTVINYSLQKYIVVDSEESPVIQIYSWAQLRRRWVYDDDETEKSLYDLYPLIPKFKRLSKPRFTLRTAQELRKEKNQELAKNWDHYFNDLITICTPRTPLSINYISMSEFLRRRSKMMIEQASYWHGFPTKSELRDLLKRFEFVAKIYDLVIAEEDKFEALSAFSSILMMYACGKYGMNKIYI